MRLKRAFWVLIFLMAAILPVLAQDRRPLGEFNISASLVAGGSVVGGGFLPVAGGGSIGVIGNPTTWFGIEGQFDAWFLPSESGFFANPARQIYATVAGPRVAFRTRYVTPFAHALAGAAYTRVLGSTYTDFVTKFGGGVDFNFGRRQLYAWRLEVNDLMFVGPVDHNFTASTGFVFRWQ